jgi:hypothetical protein
MCIFSVAVATSMAQPKETVKGFKLIIMMKEKKGLAPLVLV